VHRFSGFLEERENQKSRKQKIGNSLESCEKFEIFELQVEIK
jgi:hypothetical protein